MLYGETCASPHRLDATIPLWCAITRYDSASLRGIVIGIVCVRSQGRRAKSLVARQDGVRLTVPVFGPLEPIPHDLAHFVIERELDLQGGFWATVAGGGIVEGMQIVAGRQQPHALERSRALMKAHHRGIIFSETVVEAVMRAVNGEPLGTVALPVNHPGLPMRAR